MPGSRRSWWFGFDEEVEELTDGPFPGHRVIQRLMGLDVVAVPTAILLLDHIAGFGQVSHEAVRGALGDIEGSCYVPQTGVGIMSHEQQGAGVVGKKAPLAHRQKA